MKHYTLPHDFIKDKKADLINILSFSTKATRGVSKVTFAQHAFSFLLQGEKHLHQAATGLKIDNTQFLLIAAGNCLMRERIIKEEGEFEAISMFFDNQLLTAFFVKHGALFKDKASTSMASPVQVFKKDDFLNNFILSIKLIVESGQILTKDLLQLKFEELMIYLCHRFPEKIQSLRSYINYKVSDAEVSKVVEAHVHSNLSIEELAFLCNTSLSTFKRRFFRIYNTSPNKWILEKRMELAAKMLSGSKSKVSDIYLVLGYENLSSFIQSFKQVYGITPKQFQMQNLRAIIAL